MNKLTKSFFGIALGASMLLGVGVTVHAINNDTIQQANAYDSGTVYYYLTGSFDGASHWNNYKAAPSDGNNAGVLLNQSLKAGDLFKFKTPNTWDDALTFGSFYTGAGAYLAFYWNYGDDNVRCGATGTYNFYIWNDNGTMKVSAEFADSNTATYSYFLTSNSGYTNTYMYTGSNKIRDWADSPAVNGQAHDIKLTYSNYDYYGLYRVDDRILNGWSTVILKNSTEQSADISRTSGNKQELYMVGASTVTKTSTSNEYKAVEFLYDLVSHRGKATYDGFTFNYSICATSSSDASALVTRYDGFASGIITILNSSSCQTYNMVGNHGENNKTFQPVADIVDALRIVASRNSGSGAKTLFNLDSEGSSVATIVIIIASMSILTAGAYLFFKKSKKVGQ